jgi:hypothetical protein
MQVTVCVPDPTSASGGPSPELVALQAIRTNLEAINANTDLVESLQAAGNNTLTAVQAYVDGLEGLLGGLQTSSTSLESLMASLGINTDGIEASLATANALATSQYEVSSYRHYGGWVRTAALPAGIYPNIAGTDCSPALVIIRNTAPIGDSPYFEFSILARDTSGNIVDTIYGIQWYGLGAYGDYNAGIGQAPKLVVINNPGSLQGLDDGVISMPVAVVRSLALFPTTQAVDYSTDAGATYIRIASGSRVWTAQPGNTLNVANMRFKGNAVGAIYDIIYEV